jgi:hypothetical protein
MRDVEEQLRDEKANGRIPFSHDRHARLVASLENAVARQPETGLELTSNLRRVALVGAVALSAGLGVFLYHRQTTVDRPSQQFGAPIYLAELSIARFQGLADDFPDGASYPQLTPTSDAVRFFADQFSMARSLAAGPRRKSPA